MVEPQLPKQSVEARATLFSAVRPAMNIFLTVPFALIGITAILWPTEVPFGFMALLGAMSRMGLMIKNSIVLLDEIEANKSGGPWPVT